MFILEALTAETWKTKEYLRALFIFKKMELLPKSL